MVDPKRKPKATILVPDGADGMVPVVDRRFDEGSWALEFSVTADRADAWMAHLEAECSDRNWSRHGLGQMHPDENSGTIEIQCGSSPPRCGIIIVWERPRDGDMMVRCRTVDPTTFTEGRLRDFLEQIRQRHFADTKGVFYRRGHLQYEGIPWRGELWLDDILRLGPPSLHAPFLLAPQVILVDAMVHGVGGHGANAVFDLLMRNLSAFLSVVLRTYVQVPQIGHAWTCKTDEKGGVDCELRQLGYWEPTISHEMPRKGACPPVPCYPIIRPDLIRRGIDLSEDEQKAPQDIFDLWRSFDALSNKSRQQFVQAARAWQVALSLWTEHRSSSLAFMVVACEALKPPGKHYDGWNVYDVVSGLLSDEVASQLKGLRLRPQQDIRNVHLHRAHLDTSELINHVLTTTFRDPSLDETSTLLGTVTPAAIIEWLRKTAT